MIVFWFNKCLELELVNYNKSKSCRRLADYLRIGEEWADYFLVVASYPPVRFEKPPDLGPSVSILKRKWETNNIFHLILRSLQ